MTHRARLAVLSVALASALALPGAATIALGQTATRFKPDVTPLAISASASNPVEIEISTGTHERLRFSLKSENVGEGALELRPKREDCNGNGDLTDDRTAYQNIYGDTNNNGVYDPPTDPNPDGVVRTVKVGCFVFDPGHGHWHFRNYAKYTLKDANGTVVGTRTKVGFCLVDDDPADPPLPGQPGVAQYGSCADLAIQGTSVGYDDVYSLYLDGQSIVIDGIADGDYCLVEKVDPKNVLIETDDTNNTLRTPIQIAGTAVADGGSAC